MPLPGIRYTIAALQSLALPPSEVNTGLAAKRGVLGLPPSEVKPGLAAKRGVLGLPPSEINAGLRQAR